MSQGIQGLVKLAEKQLERQADVDLANKKLALGQKSSMVDAQQQIAELREKRKQDKEKQASQDGKAKAQSAKQSSTQQDKLFPQGASINAQSPGALQPIGGGQAAQALADVSNIGGRSGASGALGAVAGLLGGSQGSGEVGVNALTGDGGDEGPIQQQPDGTGLVTSTQEVQRRFGGGDLGAIFSIAASLGFINGKTVLKSTRTITKAEMDLSKAAASKAQQQDVTAFVTGFFGSEGTRRGILGIAGQQPGAIEALNTAAQAKDPVAMFDVIDDFDLRIEDLMEKEDQVIKISLDSAKFEESNRESLHKLNVNKIKASTLASNAAANLSNAKLAGTDPASVRAALGVKQNVAEELRAVAKENRAIDKAKQDKRDAKAAARLARDTRRGDENTYQVLTKIRDFSNVKIGTPTTHADAISRMTNLTEDGEVPSGLIMGLIASGIDINGEFPIGDKGVLSSRPAEYYNNTALAFGPGSNEELFGIINVFNEDPFDADENGVVQSNEQREWDIVNNIFAAREEYSAQGVGSDLRPRYVTRGPKGERVLRPDLANLQEHELSGHGVIGVILASKWDHSAIESPDIRRTQKNLTNLYQQRDNALNNAPRTVEDPGEEGGLLLDSAGDPVEPWKLNGQSTFLMNGGDDIDLETGMPANGSQGMSTLLPLSIIEKFQGNWSIDAAWRDQQTLSIALGLKPIDENLTPGELREQQKTNLEVTQQESELKNLEEKLGRIRADIKQNTLAPLVGRRGSVAAINRINLEKNRGFISAEVRLASRVRELKKLKSERLSKFNESVRSARKAEGKRVRSEFGAEQKKPRELTSAERNARFKRLLTERGISGDFFR